MQASPLLHMMPEELAQGDTQLHAVHVGPPSKGRPGGQFAFTGRQVLLDGRGCLRRGPGTVTRTPASQEHLRGSLHENGMKAPASRVRAGPPAPVPAHTAARRGGQISLGLQNGTRLFPNLSAVAISIRWEADSVLQVI